MDQNGYRFDKLESCGFVIYFISFLLFILFLLWALAAGTPVAPYMEEYLPSREWAVSVPSWICMAVITIYVMFIGHNLALLPALNSYYTITEEKATVGPSVTCSKGNLEAFDCSISEIQRVISKSIPEPQFS